jgi:hypothetical protein
MCFALAGMLGGQLGLDLGCIHRVLDEGPGFGTVGISIGRIGRNGRQYRTHDEANCGKFVFHFTPRELLRLHRAGLQAFQQEQDDQDYDYDADDATRTVAPAGRAAT